jgi:hypothetical protein
MRTAIDIAFWRHADRWRAPTGRDDRERDSISVANYAEFAATVAGRYPQAAVFTI